MAVGAEIQNTKGATVMGAVDVPEGMKQSKTQSMNKCVIVTVTVKRGWITDKKENINGKWGVEPEWAWERWYIYLQIWILTDLSEVNILNLFTYLFSVTDKINFISSRYCWSGRATEMEAVLSRSEEAEVAHHLPGLGPL